MSTVFPAFLKLETKPNPAAESAFISQVDKTLESAERRFQAFNAEAKRLVDGALARGGKQSGAVNIDVSGAQQAARAAQDRANAARQIADATRQAAEAEQDYSQRARLAIAATEALAIESANAATAARSHATAVQQVQTQLDAQAGSGRRITAEFENLARAEAGAADGARLLQGIYRGTSEEIGRVGKSARESAQVLDLLFQAQEAKASTAAQNFYNAALGIDAQTKSARESAQAFEALFDAQDKAAAKQSEMAASAASLRAQLDPMYAAQQRFDAELQRADDLLEAGAISTREYAQAQELARQNLRDTATAIHAEAEAAKTGTNARRSVINSARASRVAFIQLGQQMQDVTIQAQLGTNAFTIFAQQVPQAAFALSGLENSANKTQARIGKFATFMSGPWGAAIFAATAVLGPFIYSLIDAGDEADKAKDKTFDFSKAVDTLRLSAEDATRAMEQLVQETRNAIEVQGDFTAARLANAQQAVSDQQRYINSLLGERAKIEKLGTSPLTFVGIENLRDIAEIDDKLASARANLERARESVQNLGIAAAQAGVKEKMDGAAAATAEFEREVGKLKLRLEQSRVDPISATNAGVFLSLDQYEVEYERIVRNRDAAIEAIRKTEAERKRADAAARRGGSESIEQTRFISPVDGGRVSGRYGENRGSRNHGGIDLAVGVGSNVRAAAAGTVITAANLPGYGNVLIVDHGGGTTTRYAHLSKFLAQKGDAVGQGDVIALSGGARGAPGAGNSQGPHLHYEVRRGNKAVDPTKGLYPTDNIASANKAAEAARKAADAEAKRLAELQAFGDRAGESIARINERFDEQPRLIDQAAQASRRLDDIIAELEERKPVGFEQMIADAQEAKASIEDALVRPFEQLREETERRMQIDRLLLAGREDEAAVTQTLWRLEQDLGDKVYQRREYVEAIVLAEQEHLRVMERLQDEQNTYLEATRSIRGELESLFAGEGADFGRVFKRLQARINVEAIFGDALRGIDEKVKSSYDQQAQATQAKYERQVEFLGKKAKDTGSALNDLTDVIIRSTSRLGSSSAIGGSAAAEVSPWAAFLRDFDRAFDKNGSAGGAAVTGANDNEIIVTGTREGVETSHSLAGMKPGHYAELLSKDLTKPLISALDNLIGIKLPAALGDILGGAAGGYLAAGPVGAILGGAKNIPGLSAGLQTALDKAFGGAVQGSQTDSILKALGLKSSNLGATIGGAIGSIFGPVGSLIGSIFGGLIGGLFKKSKSGGVSIGDSGGTLGITGTYGNNGDRKDASTKLGGSIIDTIDRIADAIGATVDSAVGKVSIGIYKDDYRVRTDGGTKFGGFSGSEATNQQRYGLYNFHDDAEAAIRFAVANLIEDGVIGGISDAEQRLLREGDDLEKAIENVLTFRSVFDRLKAYKDPLGAALDDLDKEFQRYIDLFERAGASAEQYAQLEELYGIERAKAIEEATERVAGSLKDLLKDLTVGDSGLSLRDRRANASIEYEALAARVRAGDTTAYDDFAEAARTLLGIERQISGSQQGYFDLFAEVRSLTESALANTEATLTSAAGRDSPFSNSSIPANDNIEVIHSVDQLKDEIVNGTNTQLAAVNQNLGTMIGLLANGGISIGSGTIQYTGKTGISLY